MINYGISIDKIKKILRNRFVLVFISIVLGILYTQNEISCDNWYIEASADGLFGASNRSLWVLCSNYIITGLIWLLSLTKLRLFWLHIIIILFTFISQCLICSIIEKKFFKDGWFFSVLYLLFSTPYLFDTLSYTVAASFFSAVGLLWIFYCIHENKHKRQYIIGYLCFVIGFSLRYECVLFGSLFVFALLLIELIYSIKYGFVKEFVKKCFPPYIIIVLLFIFITGSHLVAMNYVEPGFIEWNNARSSIDDYEMISYDDNEKIFEALSLKKSDYNLMRAWNIYDKNIFDTKFYQLMKKQSTNNNVNTSDDNYWELGVEDAVNTPIMFLTLLIIFYSLWSKSNRLLLKLISFVIIYYFFIVFFLYKGRLISRIDYSIIISLFVSVVFSVCTDYRLPIFYKFNKKRVLILTSCVLILCLKPLYGNVKYDKLGGYSTIQTYLNAYKEEDSFYQYVKSLVNGEKTYQAVTFNNDISNIILSDKENIYIELMCKTWNMPYPLTDKNIFITGDEGLGSNLAFIGQYMTDLSPMQNNYSAYGVNNTSPYESIMNPNIYIVVREAEQYDRARECYEYIKDYYNSEVQYSVTDIVEDAAVGKFLSPLDVTLYDDEMEDLDISFINNYEYEGFSAIKIMDTDFLENNDIKYIQLTGQDGERYCFEEFNGNNGLFVFFDDILKSGKNYSVQLIVDNEVVKRVIALNDKLTID